MSVFPFDLMHLRKRNRKLLKSLNPKSDFADFEYKNYDSTDSDLFEEEDYLAITEKDVFKEKDYLRKRRLERRMKVKEKIEKEKELQSEIDHIRHLRGIKIEDTKHTF